MMASRRELYFVFMNYDPEYERLKSSRTKKGSQELDVYLCKKHDELLENRLEPGSYNKTMSLVIVDGFAVEITHDQVWSWILLGMELDLSSKVEHFIRLRLSRDF